MNTEFKSNRKPETRLQTRQDVCLLTHICYCWSRWRRCWLCADSFSNVFFNLLNVSTWLIGCLKRSGCLTVSLPSHIVRLPSASPLLPSPSASIFKFSDFLHLIASCLPLSVSSVILLSSCHPPSILSKHTSIYRFSASLPAAAAASKPSSDTAEMIKKERRAV